MVLELNAEARTRLRPATVTVGALVLWALVFAKVGSSLIYGIDDLLIRVRALPHLVISGDSTEDYKNWAVLPYALGKILGATTRRSFAALQFVVLVGGTVATLGVTARRDPQLAGRAALGFFACMTPAWAMFNMGTYDQLLVVLLLAVTLAERPALAAVLGALIGATHAEAGAIAILGLLAVSAVGLGPRVASRAWALGGLLAARAALAVWFRIAGQSGDRLSFLSEYGLRRMVDYLGATWPYVVWTAAAGGWLIIVGTVWLRRSLRLGVVVAAILAVNLAVTAITVDQSRVIMITTFPLVVALAAYGSRADDRSETQRIAGVLRAGGALIGLLAPLTVSWVGAIIPMGHPLRIAW